MQKNAYLVFGLLALVWGLTFLFNKTSSTLISPEQVVVVRVVIGFMPVFAVAMIRRKLRWAHLRHIHHFVVMSLLAASVYYISFARGIALLPTSVAGMLSGAIPMFSFVGAAIFLRSEPINRRSIGGLLFGFAGVMLIAQPWNTSVSVSDLAGIGYIAFGSACVGLSFVYARRFLSPLGISSLALCTYQLGLASIMMLTFTDMTNVDAIFTDWKIATGLIVGLGLFGTGIAFICYYHVVEKLGAVKAASVTYIPPVIGLITGILILGETVTVLHVVAMTIILSGVFIMQSGRTPVNPTDTRAHNRPEPA
ncbi:MAG: DMT family transporter [Thalassospira sp.]|uniref:DMT family transporter n=1 Tax=Thalassospira sp. TaxID=1912094 RepID=UPI0032EB92B7